MGLSASSEQQFPFCPDLSRPGDGAVEFEGIVSETLIRALEKRTWRTTLMWRKIARNNEPLDLMVYSLAIVSRLGVGILLSEAEAIRRAAA